MDSWSVTLFYLGDPGEEQLIAWGEELGDVAVGASPGEFTVAVWHGAGSPRDAHDAAVRQVSAVVPHDPVEVCVVEEERYIAAAHAATVPELVSSVEAADILGVSRQRVSQLAKDHPQFPAPLYELRTGPLWTRKSIVWFDRNVERRPGPRPKDTAASAATGKE